VARTIEETRKAKRESIARRRAADPEAARIAGNIAVWIVLPAAVWAAIVVAVIHAMMPVAR
jgi:hypothetical protein